MFTWQTTLENVQKMRTSQQNLIRIAFVKNILSRPLLMGSKYIKTSLKESVLILSESSIVSLSDRHFVAMLLEILIHVKFADNKRFSFSLFCPRRKGLKITSNYNFNVISSILQVSGRLFVCICTAQRIT